MRKTWPIALTAALAVTLAGAAFTFLRADEDAVLQAMRQELARSMQRLKLPEFVTPYFIAYRVTDNSSFGASATLGAVLRESAGRDRKLYVEVRVGDYAFDNSSTRSDYDHFDPDQDTLSYLQYVDLPIEDNIDALRARMWRTTDLRFKNALADYLRKKARGVYREDPDAKLADFTREPPVKRLEPPLTVDLDREAWKQTVREASALLKQRPEVLDANISVQATTSTRLLLNSEGTELATRSFLFSFNADAAALADDGMTVHHYYTRYARTPVGLPTREEVLTGVREMLEQLVALRHAPPLDPYTGPALLDPTVSGIFFHEAIGHRLEGHRTRGVDEGQTFKGKLNQKILPDFIDVYDDPTQARFGNVELNGTYAYDDEGVPAQRADLVRGGVLTDFLRSRMPIPGFDRSNGHGRAEATKTPTSRMGNVFVVARRPLPAAKLKEKLLALTREKGKPYGLRLRHGMSGETATDRFSLQAFANRPVLLYRIDAKTGREELVRGAELVGTPLSSLGRIVAGGDDPAAFNGFCGAESGYVPVAAVAPSLLVGEIELQRPQDKPTRPPVLPPPFADK